MKYKYLRVNSSQSVNCKETRFFLAIRVPKSTHGIRARYSICPTIRVDARRDGAGARLTAHNYGATTCYHEEFVPHHYYTR